MCVWERERERERERNSVYFLCYLHWSYSPLYIVLNISHLFLRLPSFLPYFLFFFSFFVVFLFFLFCCFFFSTFYIWLSSAPLFLFLFVCVIRQSCFRHCWIHQPSTASGQLLIQVAVWLTVFIHYFANYSLGLLFAWLMPWLTNCLVGDIRCFPICLMSAVKRSYTRHQNGNACLSRHYDKYGSQKKGRKD